MTSSLSFGFHAVASRLISPADYSGLVAVLALMAAMAVPVAALQTAITRAVAESFVVGRFPSARRLLELSLAWFSVVTATGCLLALVTAPLLHLNGAVPLALMGVWIAVLGPEAVAKALLVGTGALRPVSVALVVGAFARILLLVAFTIWSGLSMALLATVLGEMAGAAVLLLTAQRRGLLARRAVQISLRWSDAGRALGAQLALWVFTALAAVLGRRNLTPEVAGSFAAMVTATSACVLFPQAVGTIVFPRFVADGSSRLLWRAVGVALAVGLACAAVLEINPAFAFSHMFGPGYTPDRLVLTVLALHFLALGCLNVLAQYLLARRLRGIGWLALALVVAATVGEGAGQSPSALALSLVVPSVAALVCLGYRAQRGSVGASPITALLDLDAQPASHKTLSRPPQPGLALSVVVPSYNGGDQLRLFLPDLATTLSEAGITFELIVAVDGSTDGSDAGLEALWPGVIVDWDPLNRGKGATLRRGFGLARGALVGFIDGDGDIPATVLVDLYRGLVGSPAWLAVASKNIVGADVAARRHRRVMSLGYRWLVHRLFDVAVTDTQCGAKVFRRRYLAETVGLCREDGYAFDLELLAIGARLGLRDALEIPVVIRRGRAGTISVNGVLRMLRGTFALHRRLPAAVAASTRFVPAPEVKQRGIERLPAIPRTGAKETVLALADTAASATTTTNSEMAR